MYIKGKLGSVLCLSLICSYRIGLDAHAMCFDYCRIRVAAAAAASNVARAPSKARLTGQKPAVSELIL